MRDAQRRRFFANRRGHLADEVRVPCGRLSDELRKDRRIERQHAVHGAVNHHHRNIEPGLLQTVLVNRPAEPQRIASVGSHRRKHRPVAQALETFAQFLVGHLELSRTPWRFVEQPKIGHCWICATFSSSVKRLTRSLTRSSVGRFGFRNGSSADHATESRMTFVAAAKRIWVRIRWITACSLIEEGEARWGELLPGRKERPYHIGIMRQLQVCPREDHPMGGQIPALKPTGPTLKMLLARIPSPHCFEVTRQKGGPDFRNWKIASALTNNRPRVRLCGLDRR